MPSDHPFLEPCRTALSGDWSAYRDAAARAADEVGALIRSRATNRPPREARRARQQTFGLLGASRIDLARLLAHLDGEDRRLSPLELGLLEAAHATLREVATEEGIAGVEGGGDLTRTVRQAMARIGRAYGAAHAVALAKMGRYDPVRYGALLRSYRFERWTRLERRLVPPLIVVVDGADLKPGGLVEFLDADVKLVLLVRGTLAPPAALVRLISPGVYVAQSGGEDGAALERFRKHRGPGVFAWLPEGTARFTHDPAAGADTAARLQVDYLPPAPRRGLSGTSTAQLAEDLAALEALTRPAQPAAGPRDDRPEDPVDKLAAWILSQSGSDVQERAI